MLEKYIEQITAPATIFRRAGEGQGATVDPLKGIIEGCPIVFEQRTAIGNYFYEVIDAHALDGADLSDIKFMVNHDDGMIPLARHRRGKRSTMDISVDNVGMHIKTTLDIENNATARELCSAVTRGDIEDMSFAFGIVVSGAEWSDLESEMPTRRITKISRVFEVSAVNDGAYPQTSIYARSASALDNEKGRWITPAPPRWITKKRSGKKRKRLYGLKSKNFYFWRSKSSYEHQRTFGKARRPLGGIAETRNHGGTLCGNPLRG